MLACALYQRGPGGRPVYVHAKIGIVDDQWLTIGSANLNEHSLFNDTEVNVACHDAALATSMRHRLWAEHLETDVGTVAAGDAAALIDERWRPTAEEQRRRREADQPFTRRLVEIPHVSRRSRRLLGPIQSLLVD